MSATYARVMRATDGQGDRLAARSRAPRRPTAVSGSAAGISVVTEVSLDTAHAGEGKAETTGDSPAEATFAAAAAAFAAGQDAQARVGLQFEEVPAPKRLAPYATAVAATVQRGEVDVAWGRLVLLYDPDGQEGWEGFFRIVAYVRAD